MMTKREFFKQLKNISGHWFLLGNSIRLFKGPVKTYGNNFCPITAVCKQVTGKKVPINLTIEAVAEINLPFNLAHSIIIAADSEHAGFFDLRLKLMRRKLLRATGLA